MILTNKLNIFCLVLTVTSSALSACNTTDNGNSLTKWEWKDTTKNEQIAKPRFIWIDAAANFPRYADSKDNIQEDLEKAKNAGFTNIVVDIRPSMGDVLYKTSYTDQITKLDYWDDNDSYKFYTRKATWDYLQAFIDIGHKLGLKVDAAFNTFVGGDLYPYGLGEQGMVFREKDKRSWISTLNKKRGLTNELDLTSTDPSNEDYCGTKFLNPCNDNVQIYVLNLISDLCKYNIDGIFLDRCRFDNLEADFSNETKEKFLDYIGKKNISFQNDIMAPGTSSLPIIQPIYFQDWLSFRAKVIYDFIGKVVNRVHSINSKIKIGVYVGAWYSNYYEVGVNWASTSYDTHSSYPIWANEDYHKYGYANKLDFMLVGAYANADKIYGNTEWTMEGFCKQAKKLLCGNVKFAGGPDVSNSLGFENESDSSAVTKSIDACINASDGYFIFDMIYIRKYNYWNALKKGFDKYLNSIKQ